MLEEWSSVRESEGEPLHLNLKKWSASKEDIHHRNGSVASGTDLRAQPVDMN